MEEVKSEKDGLTQKEIFLEARKRALRFLNIPWNLWGDFCEVIGRKMSERIKEQKSGGIKTKTPATNRKPGFSNWSTEALIRDSYNVIRQRGGDPDDLDEE